MSEQWPPWSVTSLQYKLNSLSDLISSSNAQSIDPEIQGWLSRLLVVRSCGYLEQVVVEVCRGYVKYKSGGLVRAFAHSWLERSRNPGPEYLYELVGRFDGSIADEFLALLDADDGRLRRETSFLVDRRNKIAHGLNEGITQSKALQLKGTACELADWFVLKFNPER
jgi:hypothetical protein